MKIVTILHVHSNLKLVLDTLDSIQAWVGNDVLMVVDGKSWNRWGKKISVPCYKMEGFSNGIGLSSYRNQVLGMMEAAKLWPDADWFLHTEYDTLFTSSEFKKDLVEAGNRGTWCVGFDYNESNDRYPLLESMFKDEIIKSCSKYLIGCCQFFNADFIRRLSEMDFFVRFLNLTNGFSVNEFPGFKGYCFMEYLLPTLSAYLGGNIEELACWKKNNIGFGQYKKYPVRFRPYLNWEDNYPEASIMHPIKTLDDPLRNYHKEKRKNGRTKSL